MALSTQPDAESLELLRGRVAGFGLFAGAFSLFFWCFRLLTGGLDAGLGAPDSVTHLLASLLLLAAWPLLRGGTPSALFVRVVESTVLVGSCALLVVMGTTLPNLYQRPEQTMLLALTFVTCSRAVYVPSSGGRTAVLGGIVGGLLLSGVYVSYRDFDVGPLRVLDPSSTLTARDIQWGLIQGTGAWWALSAGLAFATSRVIYGLRKDVRAVRSLGQYRLHHRIGAGGMGIVYEGQHAMLRRSTAIKLLPPELAGQSALGRFEREVRLTARLRHPNTVTVYDYGRTPDGIFYYAMELLDGATLDQIVERTGAMPTARVGHVLSSMAGALSEAHGLGLIHRDVKPANVMLCNQGGKMDVVKVLDFGLVKDISHPDGDQDTALNLSQTNVITGTPLYMAPEAITDPAAVGVGGDLYAVGAVGYFLLTGQHVFDGRTVIEICGRHLHEAPEPPSQRLGRPVPDDLARLLLDCLAKSPADRPATAQVFRERLAACHLPSWGQKDAEAWWREHAPNVSARPPREAASSRTILVDLARRSPSHPPGSG